MFLYIFKIFNLSQDLSGSKPWLIYNSVSWEKAVRLRWVSLGPDEKVKGNSADDCPSCPWTRSESPYLTCLIVKNLWTGENLRWMEASLWTSKIASAWKNEESWTKAKGKEGLGREDQGESVHISVLLSTSIDLQICPGGFMRPL